MQQKNIMVAATEFSPNILTIQSVMALYSNHDDDIPVYVNRIRTAYTVLPLCNKLSHSSDGGGSPLASLVIT